MEDILEQVWKEPTYLNYWNAYRRILRLNLRDIEVSGEKRVKIAILSSFTVEPLVMYLDVDCRLAGLFPEIYVAPFNQYPQEILNEKSQVYRLSPDMVIIAVMAKSLFGDEFFADYPRLSDEEKRKRQTEVIGYLESLISKLASQTNAPILVNNFVAPWFSPFGILDNKVSLGIGEFFRGLNGMIRDLYKESRQVYVVDLEGLTGRHGKAKCTNYEMYYRGAVVFSESFLPILADEYMSYIKALKNLTRKCIVLDLDNVLWGGILGEEGVDGIKLGEDPTGRAYMDFQKLLLAYYNRGVILAVNSKNNHDEAFRVIQKHPSMILRGRHFAAMMINWKDKVENMIGLAEELNIGLDSIVFLDDSPQERERMKQALPQVLVPDLPESPFQYLEALQQIGDFNTLVLSEEDKQRGEMYYAKKRRRDLMESMSSIEDFLRSLEISAEIKLADSFTVPRITSLINRTSQFNLTTRRYNQAEVEQMCSLPSDFQIYSMRIMDRFGDEGIVGVAIVRKEGKNWIIDSFLLSCRVIGRTVETALLAKIVEDARDNGASDLIGEYIPTKKNSPARSFYSDHGFEIAEEEGESIRWMLDLTMATVKTPEWVRATYD